MLPANPSLQLYIARIDNLFEAEEKKYVQVRWLYRNTELKHSPPCAPARSEVYQTNYYDCQLIQSIVGLCHVVQHSERYKDSWTREEDKIRSDIYVCRYSYSEETGEFSESLLLDFDDNCAQGEDLRPNDLINFLVQMEENVPPPAGELWAAKRMACFNKVKELRSLEEMKQLLINLEDEFQMFTNEPSWREQVLSVESSKTLLRFIKNSGHKMKRNAERKLFLEVISPDPHQREYKRKLETSASTHSPISKRKQKEGATASFVHKGIYKLEKESIPPDAPSHLRNLRAALVYDAGKDHVVIAYPSMSSLVECFGETNRDVETSAHERSHIHGPSDQGFASTCSKPRLDEEFRMTRIAAEKIVKCLIPSSEYSRRAHLQSFWIRSGRRDAAKKDGIYCFSKGTSPSSPNQNETRLSENHSYEPFEFTAKAEAHDTLVQNDGNDHKIKYGNKNDPVSDDSGRPSIGMPRSNLKDAMNKPIRTSMVMPPIVTLCNIAFSSEETMRDTKAESNAVLDNGGNNSKIEETMSVVRWGIRRKISHQNRCRGNACSSDDFKSKVFPNQDKLLPKDQLSELESARSDPEMNPNKRIPLGSKAKILRVPKEMQGRWSSERYKAAQLKLFQIMKDKGAIPGKPLLRPALREEARKHIGDTGLLDHLLKHMTDTVINNGERFRRRHNSEGAMEYWLEDARLQEMRKQAGVDQYWIPPAGWKYGDAITDSKGDGLSQSQLKEMRSLREDVERLKSQLHHICLHLGASCVESGGTMLLGHGSGFQPWKRVDMDEQQEQAVDLEKCSAELNGINLSTEVKHEDFSTQMDAIHSAPNPGSFQANPIENKAYINELSEMANIAAGTQTIGEKKSGEELSLFYNVARSCTSMSPIKLIDTSKSNNVKKKSPGSTLPRRSPRPRVRKGSENKENIGTEKYQNEKTKACNSQINGPRLVLSPNPVNVQACSAVQITPPTESKLRLKLGPLPNRQCPEDHV
ncbi:hypothetical protein KP509_24G022600 [Ceratopteris richardii]|uniref:BAH domain-containing protein n=1 Tax=Ceratopteris richardii TaxID=49495 RepID=A0A8T2RW53_CERRI|nr:hypothetical protein KP509_24G022600 [Ceratopteris richardii]